MGIQTRARCHICKLCVYNKNIFFHVLPTTRLAMNGAVLCHKQVGVPWHNRMHKPGKVVRGVLAEIVANAE
jgi:hypothetical protein